MTQTLASRLRHHVRKAALTRAEAERYIHEEAAAVVKELRKEEAHQARRRELLAPERSHPDQVVPASGRPVPVRQMRLSVEEEAKAAQEEDRERIRETLAEARAQLQEQQLALVDAHAHQREAQRLQQLALMDTAAQQREAARENRSVARDQSKALADRANLDRLATIISSEIARLPAAQRALLLTAGPGGSVVGPGSVGGPGVGSAAAGTSLPPFSLYTADEAGAPQRVDLSNRDAPPAYDADLLASRALELQREHTVAQLKARMATLGAQAPSRANKADLALILAQAEQSAASAATPPRPRRTGPLGSISSAVRSALGFREPPSPD